MADSKVSDDFPWSLGVFDAHCHPTDTLSSLQAVPSMRAKGLTVMATRAQDQELVANAARDMGITAQDLVDSEKDWSQGHKLIPAFGWHPWFSHHMFEESDYERATSLSDEQKVFHYQNVLTPNSASRDFLLSLPPPQPFGHFLAHTREYLEHYPLALIGEVGLDKSFRIPEACLPEHLERRNDGLTPGGREGRKLSLYRVSMHHQRSVLLAQLRLAGEMHRAVSCHGVQAHGILYETLAESWKGHERRVPSKKERKKAESAAKVHAELEHAEAVEFEPSGPKPYPPRICLHSYSGPADAVKQYIAPSVPCDVFFSFSTTINTWSESGEGKVEAAVRAVPDNKVLIESDLHTAGDRMDHYLEDGVRKLCVVKGWELEHGVRQLGSNWRRFVFGRD